MSFGQDAVVFVGTQVKLGAQVLNSTVKHSGECLRTKPRVAFLQLSQLFRSDARLCCSCLSCTDNITIVVPPGPTADAGPDLVYCQGSAPITIGERPDNFAKPTANSV